MKKKWVAPRVEVQKFEANEYVAACWGVACDKGVNNEWNWENGFYLHHASGVCGSFDNQVVYDYDNDGQADKMVEIHWNERDAAIYTDSSYSATKDIHDVKPGQTIYWITTDPLVGIKYHHVGTVKETVPGHPNRS